MNTARGSKPRRDDRRGELTRHLNGASNCDGDELTLIGRIRKTDICGMRFGRLLVLRVDPVRKSLNVLWSCLCDCGSITLVTKSRLMRGETSSCGCYQRDAHRMATTSHGMSGTKIYKSWQAMVKRCSKDGGKSWKYYGGRGIKVCERWMSFDNFYADMGDRPHEDFSIDRIDPDGDYEPGNCRWADKRTQSANRSAWTIDIEGQCLKHACEYHGISYARALKLHRQGMIKSMACLIWYRFNFHPSDFISNNDRKVNKKRAPYGLED